MLKSRFVSALALTATLVGGNALASGVPIVESVTGGKLDQTWESTFDLPYNVFGLTLDPSDPAYDNPSGDRTVMNAPNAEPFVGGLNKHVIDPQGADDYTWEAWMFTGDGSTRRGIVLRATGEAGNRNDCYQFVLEQGLLQINFRKLVASAPTNLGSWFTTDTASGFPGTDTWIHLKVEAVGDNFRIFYNGEELTGGTPIVDSSLPSGWAGVYNFNFAVGNVPCYFDDLTLTPLGTVSVDATSWSGVKSLYR